MPFLAGLVSVVAFTLNDLLFRVMVPAAGVWVMLLWANVALAVAVGAGLLAKRDGFWPKNLWGWPLGVALARAVGIFAALKAFEVLPVAQAYLILFTYPLLIAIAESFIHRHFLRRYAVLLAIAMAGIGLVFYSDQFASDWGVLWAVLVSLMCALQIIGTRRMPHESFTKICFSNALWGIAAAAVGFAVLPHFQLHLAGGIAPWQWVGLVAVSVFGPLGEIYAAQRMPSTRYAILCYLQIPLAAVLAWMLLGEAITLRMGIGLAMVTVASVLSQLPEKGSPKPPVVPQTWKP